MFRTNILTRRIEPYNIINRTNKMNKNFETQCKKCSCSYLTKNKQLMCRRFDNKCVISVRNNPDECGRLAKKFNHKSVSRCCKDSQHKVFCTREMNCKHDEFDLHYDSILMDICSYYNLKRNLNF